MRSMLKMNGRERRYWMWRLAFEAVQHLDAKRTKKLQKTRAVAADPGPPALNLDLQTTQNKHPME
jgi:hypothetical protein